METVIMTSQANSDAVEEAKRIWRVPIPDPLDPDGIRSVYVAHGGPPIPTFDGLQRLWDMRASGAIAIVHEIPKITAPWTVYSEEPWFSALSGFDREYLAFAVMFARGSLGTSRKPFFRLLMCAATIDGYLDLDSDEQLSAAWQYFLEVEQRIGCRLQDVPSLVALEPVMFLMARHCLDVSRLFCEKLDGEWSAASIEREIRKIEAHGPIGRVLASTLMADLRNSRGFHGRLRAETIDHFQVLAKEACGRLAKTSTAVAYQAHPRRKPALTMKGIENAIFMALAQDFVDRGLSRSEAARLASDFLSRVVGGPFAGDEGLKFNRRNHIRWASKHLRRSH
jgi:hypothetical protein